MLANGDWLESFQLMKLESRCSGGRFIGTSFNWLTASFNSLWSRIRCTTLKMQTPYANVRKYNRNLWPGVILPSFCLASSCLSGNPVILIIVQPLEASSRKSVVVSSFSRSSDHSTKSQQNDSEVFAQCDSFNSLKFLTGVEWKKRIASFSSRRKAIYGVAELFWFYIFLKETGSRH